MAAYPKLTKILAAKQGLHCGHLNVNGNCRNWKNWNCCYLKLNSISLQLLRPIFCNYWDPFIWKHHGQ